MVRAQRHSRNMRRETTTAAIVILHRLHRRLVRGGAADFTITTATANSEVWSERKPQPITHDDNSTVWRIKVSYFVLLNAERELLLPQTQVLWGWSSNFKAEIFIHNTHTHTR